MYIEEILEKLNNFEDDKKIKISDGTYIKNEFGSDRGDYYDMYIGYTKNIDDKTIQTVKEFKDLIYRALKQEVMMGYKGGEFNITEHTNVTIGEFGYSGEYIDDIREKDGIVYLVYVKQQIVEVWK